METQYKIIGGDGREYGPVALEDLELWVRQGRVLAETRIWSSSLEVWRTADQTPELASALAEVSASAGPSPRPIATEVASPWPRLAAFLVDTFIASTVAQILWHSIAMFANLDPKTPAMPANLDGLQQYLRQTAPQMLVFHLCRMVLEVGFNGTFGGTVGKLVSGLRIVRMDGTPIGYGIAFIRFWARFASELPLYAGYLPILFRKDRRGAHDLVCGTQVVTIRPRRSGNSEA